VRATCPTPRLNWSSSSVPPGTISTIRSPLGPRGIQQNCLVSDARLRREEHAPTRRARETSTTWEAIRVRERADTATSGLRESRHCQSRVRERADTTSSGFEREPTLPVQGSRESGDRQFRVEREPTLLVQRSRESGHRQFRVRERADTASPGFEGEQTPLFQGSRESRHGQFRVRERADHGLKREPAGEAALVHRTG